MVQRLALFADAELADACTTAVEGAGGRAVVLADSHRDHPPELHVWERAVSELPLCQWLLLPSRGAAEAVLEACGSPPAALVRVAAVEAAVPALTESGRRPDIAAAGLRLLLDRLAPLLGRRQRVLVPHAHGAGRRVGGRLAELGAEPLCVAAYQYSIPAAGRSAWQSCDRIVAVAGTPDEVEILHRALEIARPGSAAGTPLATRSQAAEDAAADCGFARVRRAGAHLEPFLAVAFRRPAP